MIFFSVLWPPVGDVLLKVAFIVLVLNIWHSAKSTTHFSSSEKQPSSLPNISSQRNAYLHLNYLFQGKL